MLKIIQRHSGTKKFTISVIVNSFPKSGTHLLLQVIEPLPNLTNYGFFIASAPSRPHKIRNESKHKKLISKIIAGELVRGHLYFNKNHAQLLMDKNVIHFFIYRDLRDVIVSEALYLTYMNKWHQLHSYFVKQLSNDEERITAAITGIKSTKFYYPDIRTRWENYSEWLNEDQVWIATDVFVGPGVKIGFGTVVGARSSVFYDLPREKICFGTPAKPIRDR